jgi:hypothetical protein
VLLTLTLPRLNDLMTTAMIDQVHATPGTALATGAALFDVTVDLSGVAPHDCPPVSHYRIVLREPAWLRRIDVAAGATVALHAPLAQFTTAEDEPLAADAMRAVRVTIAGILRADDDWGDAA